MAPDPHSNGQMALDKISLEGSFDDSDDLNSKLEQHIQALKVKVYPSVFPLTPVKAESTVQMARSHQSEDAKKTFTNGPDQVLPSENIISWEPDVPVKIRLEEKGMGSLPPISVPGMLKQTAEKYPNHNALAYKDNGKWQFITYSQYLADVRTVAKAFIKLGLERFYGVGIMGFNSKEWFYANLGTIFAGGLSAGVYTTNSPEACAHCAVDCKAQICVVEDGKQLDKILKVKKQLPNLKAIIQYKGTPTAPGVLSWKDVMEIGAKETDEILEERLSQIAVNQCCTLIYTSGTTGPPKGVMLSHDNITWNSIITGRNLGLSEGVEKTVTYLPLSHVAAQLADLYIPISQGNTTYFAQPDALKGSLVVTLKEVKPSVVLGVPRVWEKMYEKMMEIGRKTTGVKKTISTWAKSVGAQASDYRRMNDSTRPFGYKLAQAVVFKKVKAALGFDNAKIFISAAAPISMDIVKYFHSLDIPLVEIFGMSECSAPHAIGLPTAYKFGSVGRSMEGCYTIVVNPDSEGNGEMCLGGRNICMGYKNMEEKTRESIDTDGYLHTGDIAKIDEDGFVYITGRIKELIITAGGENVPPILIEDELKKNLPCLSNAMLVGDRRKFLSVLLTLKTDMCEDGRPLNTLAPACVDWLSSLGIEAKTVNDILDGPNEKFTAAIQEGIDRTNKVATSNAQKIQKWSILREDFSVPGEELGPTLKLKRSFVASKYNKTIDKFYN